MCRLPHQCVEISYFLTLCLLHDLMASHLIIEFCQYGQSILIRLPIKSREKDQSPASILIFLASHLHFSCIDQSYCLSSDSSCFRARAQSEIGQPLLEFTMGFSFYYLSHIHSHIQRS